MSGYVSYLHVKSKCQKCKTFYLNECILRPVEDAGGPFKTKFSATSTGWLLCECGFRWRSDLHSVPVKGGD